MYNRILFRVARESLHYKPTNIVLAGIDAQCRSTYLSLPEFTANLIDLFCPKKIVLTWSSSLFEQSGLPLMEPIHHKEIEEILEAG